MSSNITLQKPKKLISIKLRGLLRDSTTLGHIIAQIAQSDSLFHFNFEVLDWNNQITDINNRLELTIPQISYPPDTTWATTATSYLNTIKHLIKTEEQHIRDVAIKERLVARAENTITNQSRMLASILNRDYNSIRVDRLVVMENNKPVLYTHPDDIQRLAPTQYQALLKPRQHHFDNMPEEWISIYSPLNHVKPDIYTDLDAPPTFTEWQRAINKCSPSSAAGMSGISYRHIKKLHPDVHEQLRIWAGQIFRSGIIPTDWKTSQLFPIPKSTDWHFQLNNTRPILLLECLRKLIIRVLNERLANIMVKHDILKGPNFAGLPRGNTRTPI